MKVNEFLNNIYYFSENDFKSFEKFLLSPYFNNLQASVIVYRIIKKYISFIPLKKFDELKSIITKETKYTEATVRKILAHLNVLYIDYIKILSFKNNEFYNEYISCNYLLKKGNYNLLSKKLDTIDKLLTDPKSLDDDLFIKLYDTDILHYDILATTDDKFNPLSKLNKRKVYTLESTKNLMVYTLSKATLNYVNFVLQCVNSNSYNDNIYPVNLEKLFSLIKTPEFDSYNDIQKATILLYYNSFKLYSNTLNDKYYDEYKDYFNKVKHLYNTEFCKTHTSILLNYCFLRHRTKDRTRFYRTESLSLLFEYMENGYYKNDKTEYLNSVMYRNFVVTCINVERKEILQKFISVHTDKLIPSDIEDMRDFALSHYYYLIGDFKLSIELSESLNNTKFLYRYDINNLIIRNYFELSDFVSLENILHNYKLFIKEDDFLTKYDKERYRYFVYCMKKYLVAYNRYEKKQNIFDFEYLLKLISKNPNFVMKNWLNEKVNEFILNHNKKHQPDIISNNL
jgi:hypothetical protein